MGSKVHLSLNSSAYNRRDSFGLGWADQWDYKFNDEKLLKSNSHNNSCSRKINNTSSSSFSSSSSSSSTTKTIFASKLGVGTMGSSKSMKFGKENKPSNLSSSSTTPTTNSSLLSSSFAHKTPIGSSKKLSELNRKVSSAANSGAHKVKASTNMGIKWLKKQCSMKTLKPSSDHSS